MGLNIIELIRGRKQARAAGIEELAKRLAAGEAVPPDEIEAILGRTGCDETALQERVDALERRAELIAKVAKGEAAESVLDRIEGECDRAMQVIADAQRKHAAVVAKHADELLKARGAIEAANTAREALLKPENLSPADRERLAEARKVASAAAGAAEELRRNIPELQRSAEESEQMLADAVETLRAFRNDAGALDLKARAENAVKARGQRLKDAEAELPKLQAEAARTAAAVAAIEDELRS